MTRVSRWYWEYVLSYGKIITGPMFSTIRTICSNCTICTICSIRFFLLLSFSFSLLEKKREE